MTHRIALLAYNCRPLSGSDPGLGWQWAEQAGRDHEVTLFTRATNREEIERYGVPRGVTAVYVDLPEPELGRFRVGMPWYDALHCGLWLRKATGRIDPEDFDLVHFATFSAYWMSGPFHRTGLPVLGGVFTGGERTNPAFGPWLDQASARSDNARSKLMAAAVRAPQWRKSYGSERSLMVVESEDLADLATSAGAKHVEVFRPPMSMAADLRAQLTAIRRAASPDDRGPKLVTSGRQFPWKGFRWAIEALDDLRRDHPDAVLDVIGDGGQHEQLVALAAERGLGERVRFHRSFTLEEERRIIAEADMFLFPSQRDGGAAVLQFAMGLGTPVVGFPIGAAPRVAGDAAAWVDLDRIADRDGSRPGDLLADRVRSLLADPAEREMLIARGDERLDGALSETQSQIALSGWYHHVVDSSASD